MKLKKSIVSKIAALSLAIVMMFTFTACGGAENLEEFVDNNPEIMEEVEEAVEGTGMTVEFEGNKVIYTYAFTETLTEEQVELMAEQFESSIGSMESTFTGIIADLEEDSKIDGISIVITYEDAAGTEIYTHEFK